MGINFISPAGNTTAFVIGDTGPTTANPNGPIDAVPQLTQVGGVPAAAACEIQSTEGALLIPRMTTAQKNALGTANVSAIVDGMIVYDSTLGSFSFRESGVWNTIAAGTVSGPGAATVNAIVTWGNVGGTQLLNSVVLLDVTGNLTGVHSVANGVGAIGTPSYTFTGDLNTGMWSSVTDTIDFSVTGTRVLQLGSASGFFVNYLNIVGGPTGDGPELLAKGTDVNIDIVLSPKGSGGVSIFNQTNPGLLKFWDDSATNFVAFEAASAIGTNVTWTLPAADATVSGQALTSNSGGILSWQSVGAAAVQTAVVNVTAAQINNLHISGLSILAAPGANLMIKVLGVMAEYIHNTTPFTPGGASLNFVYSSSGTLSFATSVSATGFLDQTVNTITNPTLAGSAAASADFVNISLSLASSGGTISAGDGTMVLTISYQVIAAS